MMALWRELLRKLRTATPRERAGLALVAALLGAAMAAWSFDWALSAEQTARDAQARHAQAEAALARDSDPAFQESLAAEINKVWRGSFVEVSEGVARAQAVAAVEGLAAQAGLGRVSVTLNEMAAEETTDAVTPLSLTLSADFEWSSFLALLETMEVSELSLAPEAVAVDLDQDQTPTLIISLRAAFLREAQLP